jgi:hypothetical protein
MDISLRDFYIIISHNCVHWILYGNIFTWTAFRYFAQNTSHSTWDSSSVTSVGILIWLGRKAYVKLNYKENK